jgi:hypothetical protein
MFLSFRFTATVLLMHFTFCRFFCFTNGNSIKTTITKPSYFLLSRSCLQIDINIQENINLDRHTTPAFCWEAILYHSACITVTVVSGPNDQQKVDWKDNQNALGGRLITHTHVNTDTKQSGVICLSRMKCTENEIQERYLMQLGHINAAHADHSAVLNIHCQSTVNWYGH